MKRLVVVLFVVLTAGSVSAVQEKLFGPTHEASREDGKKFNIKNLGGKVARILDVRPEFNTVVRTHTVKPAGIIYSRGPRRLHVVMDVGGIRYVVTVFDAAAWNGKWLKHPDFDFLATRIKGDAVKIYLGKVAMNAVLDRGLITWSYSFEETEWLRFKK